MGHFAKITFFILLVISLATVNGQNSQNNPCPPDAEVTSYPLKNAGTQICSNLKNQTDCQLGCQADNQLQNTYVSGWCMKTGDNPGQCLCQKNLNCTGLAATSHAPPVVDFTAPTHATLIVMVLVSFLRVFY
ncbi:unnamed protein product [Cuscuta epithymum]|uniref:Uncharacterized protein n=1 Tax=Cuscuta epithymum TaxID=186058 RepID=A0AAV0EV38_9ASTE|nr:unnamed protein product [Cuscuta epithymum]